MILLLYAATIAIFVGDFKLYVGASSATIPMGLIPVALLLILRLGLRPEAVVVPKLTFASLLTIISCGLVGGFIANPDGMARTAVAMLPVFFVLVTIVGLYGLPYARSMDRAMNAGGVVLAVMVLVLFSFSLFTEGGYYEKKLMIETPLGRSNYLAAFITFSVLRNTYSAPRLNWICIPALVATLSRAGIALCLVSLVVRYLFDRRHFWLFSSVTIVTLFGIGIWSDEVFRHVQEAFPGVADYSSVHNRWLLWEFSTGLVSDNPVLGVGPNGFRTAIEQDPSMEDVWGPHNAVLLLWLNYGLLGVIGYTVYMSVVWRAIHAASKIERSWCGTKIGFVALLVFSLFEPLVGSASFELLIAVLYCQALSLQRTFYSPTNALGDGGKLISPVIPGVLSSSELIVPLHRL